MEKLETNVKSAVFSQLQYLVKNLNSNINLSAAQNEADKVSTSTPALS